MDLAAEYQWDDLMELAEDLEPILHQGFLEVLDRLRGAYTLPVLEEAIRTGQVETLVANVITNAQTFAPLMTAVATVVGRIAQAELNSLPSSVRIRTLQPPPPPAGGAPHG